MKKNKRRIFLPGLILVILWIARAAYVTHVWKDKYPISLQELDSTVFQNGMEIRVLEHEWLSEDELEERYGELDEAHKEAYAAVMNDDYCCLVVLYELKNTTEETIRYAAHDIVLCGKNWAVAGFHPYQNACNGGDSFSARTVEGGATAYYTTIYNVRKEWEPEFLEFGYDSSLIKMKVDALVIDR